MMMVNTTPELPSQLVGETTCKFTFGTTMERDHSAMTLPGRFQITSGNNFPARQVYCYKCWIQIAKRLEVVGPLLVF